MGDTIGTDGGETKVSRREQEASGNYDHRQGLVGFRGEGAIGGSEPIGVHRADRPGRDRRRKPVTHGKTLSFLLQSLADQLEESQEAQKREVARQKRIEQQIQQVQAALEAWRESVADVVEDLPDV